MESILRGITARYLQRYHTSRAHLRRLLSDRARRIPGHPEGPGALEALVDAELDRLEELGLLDDHRFASDRARGLQRRGSSRLKIRAALRAKGLAAEPIDEALAALGEGAELEAAAAWARKHRVGPWRSGSFDAALRRKELARMGRAGFGYAVACQVVDAASDEVGRQPSPSL